MADMFFLFDADLHKREMASRLVKAREEAGFPKRVDAVRRFQWNPNTYKAHEYGQRQFSEVDAAKYGQAYGKSAEFLLALDLLDKSKAGRQQTPLQKEKPSTSWQVVQRGPAASGVWIEGKDEPFGRDTVPVPGSPSYPIEQQYARKVRGDLGLGALNDGDFAIFVSIPSDEVQHLDAGSLVDVERIKDGLREYSVMLFDGANLVAPSMGMGRKPITIGSNSDGSTANIVGIAVAAYRNLIIGT